MGEFKHILATEPGPHETMSENSKQNGKRGKAAWSYRGMELQFPVS